MSQNYYISMKDMGYITEETCDMTVLRGHTIFVVKVEIARVKNTSFGKELLRQIEVWEGLPWCPAIDKPVFDLIYQHCRPLLERLAPQTSLQDDLSLDGFLHSPTYNLEIIDGGVDEDIRITGADECLYTPAFFTTPMRTADLPEPCKTLPLFQARDISIAPIMNEGKTIDAIQGRVVTAEGIPMYFKPRVDMREAEFERELRILLRIDEVGLTARLRVPKLQGIVVLGEKTIGMLMTYITSSKIGIHLRSPGLLGKHEFHKKWEEQLIVIVQELHAHGIVWGDVNPMNVLIDEAMDAWAIDFGGMNNAEFVDDEKRETIEGDWQGMTRLFQEWLPNPQRPS
jgi:tRNA A-37 threonylcarbamoyl transferase component Bud32